MRFCRLPGRVYLLYTRPFHLHTARTWQRAWISCIVTLCDANYINYSTDRWGHGWSIFEYIVYQGMTDLIPACVAAGADLDVSSGYPLRRSAHKKGRNMTKALILAGADHSLAMHYASRKQSARIWSVFLQVVHKFSKIK